MMSLVCHTHELIIIHTRIRQSIITLIHTPYTVCQGLSEQPQHTTMVLNYWKAEIFDNTKETVEKVQICIFVNFKHSQIKWLQSPK